jgi:hypothetical protein
LSVKEESHVPTASESELLTLIDQETLAMSNEHIGNADKVCLQSKLLKIATEATENWSKGRSGHRRHFPSNVVRLLTLDDDTVHLGISVDPTCELNSTYKYSEIRNADEKNIVQGLNKIFSAIDDMYEYSQEFSVYDQEKYQKQILSWSDNLNTQLGNKYPECKDIYIKTSSCTRSNNRQKLCFSCTVGPATSVKQFQIGEFTKSQVNDQDFKSMIDKIEPTIVSFITDKVTALRRYNFINQTYLHIIDWMGERNTFLKKNQYKFKFVCVTNTTAPCDLDNAQFTIKIHEQNKTSDNLHVLSFKIGVDTAVINNELLALFEKYLDKYNTAQNQTKQDPCKEERRPMTAEEISRQLKLCEGKIESFYDDQDLFNTWKEYATKYITERVEKDYPASKYPERPTVGVHLVRSGCTSCTMLSVTCNSVMQTYFLYSTDSHKLEYLAAHTINLLQGLLSDATQKLVNQNKPTGSYNPFVPTINEKETVADTVKQACDKILKDFTQKLSILTYIDGIVTTNQQKYEKWMINLKFGETTIAKDTLVVKTDKVS